MLEVMIVTAIVAILAAIALPNYADYVTRGKITEATTALSDMRQRYEQFFLDNRSYLNGCATVEPLIQPQSGFCHQLRRCKRKYRVGFELFDQRERPGVDDRVHLFD